jgi:phenylacetate-CoA ligase
MSRLVEVPGLAAAVWWHRTAARERVEAFQAERLRRLVRHAYARVPYYRRLFDGAGVRPEEIHSLADLPRLPLSAKSNYRAAPVRDLVADDLDPARLIEQRTSGSTGQRLVVYRTWLEVRLHHLFRLRALADVGVRPRDLIAQVGLQHSVHPHDHKLIGRALAAAGLTRRVRIDLFSSPEQQAEQLRAARVDVVSGYPGALGRLASHLLDAGIDDIRPRLVLVGAEVLTPPLRRAIEQAFAAPVIDLYGSHEFNLLGWECRVTGAMHVPDDSLAVEILVDGRPARPGETGEVVVTSLHLHAMPLIRYRLGDLATRDETPCACGAPWTTLRSVQGRTVDWFSLPDGRLLHPYRISQGFFAGRALPVRHYQLVQLSPDRIVLRIVVPADAPTAAIADAEAAVQALLGPSVHFSTERVPEIRPDANGKYRLFQAAAAPAVGVGA